MGTKQLKENFPEWYEEWLFSSLEIQNGDVCQEKYLKPLIALNNNWLQENYNKDEYKWNDLEVATAYALYYMTANIPKLWMVLNNSKKWQSNQLKNISHITEFGCGPGTFLWSYLIYLYVNDPKALKKIKQIRGIDHSKENLQIAKKLFYGLKEIPEFSHIKAQFSFGEWQEEILTVKEIDNQHHLSIFGNSLIESNQSIDQIYNFNFYHLLMIEPGTSKHFSRLKKVRDTLVENNYTIHFPCPGNFTCPMKNDNWCHFSVNRFLLPFMQKMSTACGRKNHRHHFSAFLFSRTQKSETGEEWRLLSKPRKAKGSVIRHICNGKYLKEVVLNKKEKSDLNRSFIKAEVGNLGYCSSPLKNNRLKSTDKFTI